MTKITQFTIDQFIDPIDLSDLLDEIDSFHCDGVTYRKEARWHGRYWYGYKKIARKVYKVYTGTKWDLRIDRMNSVKQQLIDKSNGVTVEIRPVVKQPTAYDIFNAWVDGVGIATTGNEA